MKKENISMYLPNIKRWEKFRSKAYKPVPTEKKYTIGYGHYGVEKDATISKKKATKLLEKDVRVRLPRLKKEFPEKWDTFSDNLKIKLMSGMFRGDFDPQTKKAFAKRTVNSINYGDFKKASKDFLVNEEYKRSKASAKFPKKSGKRFTGVAARMEEISNAIAAEPHGFVDHEDHGKTNYEEEKAKHEYYRYLEYFN